MAQKEVPPFSHRYRLNRFRRQSVLVFSIALLSLACSGAPEAAGRERGPLKFEVLFDQPTYTGADPIRISFKLTNVSKEPIWVNTRFYLSSPKVSNRHREVALEVTGPDGKELPCKYEHETGLPRSDLFQRLDPGGEVVSDNSRYFKGYYDVQDAGTYTVTASYKNVYGEELGLDVYKSLVISKPVTFVIEQGSP